MSQVRFKPKWSFWFDSHYNHDTFFVMRPGISYHFEAGPSLTWGYAYLLTSSGPEGRLERQEHRPWAQAVLPFTFGDAWRFTQRIRTDFRFRQNIENSQVVPGWSFVFRPRLQTVVTYDLPDTPLGGPFLQTAVELLVNAGQVDRSRQLDQVRTSLLVGLKVEDMVFRIGYMDRYLPRRGQTRAAHEHTLLLWYNFNLNLVDRETPIPPEGTNP